MHGLVLALSGSGFACAIGALLPDAPSPVTDWPRKAAALGNESGWGAWWGRRFLLADAACNQPRRLMRTLTIAVITQGVFAHGIEGELWVNAAASPKAGEENLLGTGVLILLAPAAGRLRQRTAE